MAGTCDNYCGYCGGGEKYPPPTPALLPLKRQEDEEEEEDEGDDDTIDGTAVEGAIDGEGDTPDTTTHGQEEKEGSGRVEQRGGRMDQHQWEDVTIPDYAHPPTAATSVLPFLMIESPTLRQLRGLNELYPSMHRSAAADPLPATAEYE